MRFPSNLFDFITSFQRRCQLKDKEGALLPSGCVDIFNYCIHVIPRLHIHYTYMCLHHAGIQGSRSLVLPASIHVSRVIHLVVGLKGGRGDGVVSCAQVEHKFTWRTHREYSIGRGPRCQNVVFLYSNFPFLLFSIYSLYVVDP